jgi:hypothetical protein
MALASMAFLMPLAGVAPAAAASSDAAMLQSYAGNYTGTGTISGGSSPQPVTCRISMQSAAPGKLNYIGRCSAGVSFSLSGVITAANGRIQSTMSGSGGGMSGAGTVTGARNGNGVSFSSSSRDTSTHKLTKGSVSFRKGR